VHKERADYVCDGVDDQIEIQQAIDALPADGGGVVLLDGTFELSAQITRAIDNISISGQGRGTVLNLDGVTPVITVGSQKGWALNNFQTDRGGVGINGSTQVNVHNGTQWLTPESLTPRYLPLRATWVDSGLVVPKIGLGTSHDMAQPFLTKINDKYLCYYEYNCAGIGYQIAVAEANSIKGPWTTHAAILTFSGNAGDPDEIYVADPTVLFINGKYHMWFDQSDVACGLSGTKTTIGHATSNDGIVWAKQQTGGVTDIVIGKGTYTSYDDLSAHAPEAVIYNGVVNLLYACHGSDPEYVGAHDFNTALAIASDPNGLGTSFKKRGQVTWHDTSTKIGHRLSAVVMYNSILYGHLAKTGGDHKGVFVSSSDYGKSWAQIAECSVWFHSFLIEDNIVWGLEQDTGKLYYFDLLDYTEGAESSDAKNVVHHPASSFHALSKGSAGTNELYLYFAEGISSTPRTATILSVSGDVISLTGNDAYKFYHSNSMPYLKIANTSKSPVGYAWIKATSAADKLTVTDSTDVATWANPNTISTAEDGVASSKVELDLSPLMPPEAKAIVVGGSIKDSIINENRGIVISPYLSGYPGYIVNPQVVDISIKGGVTIPISLNSEKGYAQVFVRDIISGIGSVWWRIYGYFD
jgi:hypothetical protein